MHYVMMRANMHQWRGPLTQCCHSRSLQLAGSAAACEVVFVRGLLEFVPVGQLCSSCHPLHPRESNVHHSTPFSPNPAHGQHYQCNCASGSSAHFSANTARRRPIFIPCPGKGASQYRQEAEPCWECREAGKATSAWRQRCGQIPPCQRQVSAFQS